MPTSTELILARLFERVARAFLEASEELLTVELSNIEPTKTVTLGARLPQTLPQRRSSAAKYAIDLVCDRLEIPPDTLGTPRRTAAQVAARQNIWYILREADSEWPWKELAAMFGKGHTTAMHGHAAICGKMRINPSEYQWMALAIADAQQIIHPAE